MLNASRIEIKRVQGGTSCNIKAVSMRTTEGEVTNLFWNQDLTQLRRIVTINLDAISRTREDVSVYVDAKPVGKSGIYNRENPTILQSSAVHHVKSHDVMIPFRIERRGSVCNVENSLIWRKSQAVWLDNLICYNRQVTASLVQNGKRSNLPVRFLLCSPHDR